LAKAIIRLAEEPVNPRFLAMAEQKRNSPSKFTFCSFVSPLTVVKARHPTQHFLEQKQLRKYSITSRDTASKTGQQMANQVERC
jgi:hypothetical protein